MDNFFEFYKDWDVFHTLVFVLIVYLIVTSPVVQYLLPKSIKDKINKNGSLNGYSRGNSQQNSITSQYDRGLLMELQKRLEQHEKNYIESITRIEETLKGMKEDIKRCLDKLEDTSKLEEKVKHLQESDARQWNAIDELRRQN